MKYTAVLPLPLLLSLATFGCHSPADWLDGPETDALTRGDGGLASSPPLIGDCTGSDDDSGDSDQADLAIEPVVTNFECRSLGGDATPSYELANNAMDFSDLSLSTTSSEPNVELGCVTSLTIPALDSGRIKMDGDFSYRGDVLVSALGRGRFSYQQRAFDVQSDVVVQAFEAGTADSFEFTGVLDPAPAAECGAAVTLRIGFTLRARRASEEVEQTTTRLNRVVLPHFYYESC